jgi:hypothetical protein
MTTVELSKYIRHSKPNPKYGTGESWFLKYLGHEFQIYKSGTDENTKWWSATQVYEDSYDQGDSESGTKEEVRDWLCKWFQDIVSESMPFVEVKFIWKENHDA